MGLAIFLFGLCFVSIAATMESQLVQELKRGVVKLKAKAEGTTRIGTGIIVGLNKDAVYIATASHVIEGDPNPEVTFFSAPYTSFRSKVLGLEGGNPRGLAVLVVEGQFPSEMKIFPLEQTITVNGGEDVTLIGFPRSSGVPWTVTPSSVTGLAGRNISLYQGAEEGNSGGPVLYKNKVLGLVTEVRGQYSFAVPATQISEALRGWNVPIGDLTKKTLPDIPVPGYTVAEGTGVVSGKVTFAGSPPPPKEFLFSKFPNPRYCAQTSKKRGDIRYMPLIEVGPNGGLQNAIVVVSDIVDQEWMGRYPGTNVVMELCDFAPFTSVVVNRKPMLVENRDADPTDPKSIRGVIHNPHSFEVLGSSQTTIFNIGLAEKGSRLDKPITVRKQQQGSTVRLQCDQHEYMQAYFLPVTNSHFAILGENGTFEIKGVPAGQHKLTVWHPFAGRVDADIVVADQGVVTQNFVLPR
jgi:hypothetical protein